MSLKCGWMGLCALLLVSCGGAKPSAAVATDAATSPWAAMPRDAAAYGLVTRGTLQRVLAGSKANMQRMLGSVPSEFRLLELAGVPADKPIYVAIATTMHTRSAAMMDTLLKTKQAPDVERELLASPESYALFVRLMVPLSAGAKAEDVSRSIMEILRPTSALENCLNCLGAAAAPQPFALVRTTEATVAFYQLTGALRVDVAIPLFGRNAHQAWIIDGLTKFAANGGGPGPGHCDELARASAGGFCADADRAAETATTQGYSQVVRALSSAMIDPKDALEILKEGRREAETILSLAAKQPVLMDDGTMLIGAEGGVSSWRMGASVAPRVSKAFASERCATNGEEGLTLARELASALGQPSHDISQLRADVRDGGVGAFVILFARAWPHLLLGLDKGQHEGLMADAAEAWKFSGGESLRVCAKTKGQRLELSTSPLVTPPPK